MDSFQCLIWLMLLLGFVYYLKQVKTASEEQRSRILDLLIVGAIVAVVPYFTEDRGWVFNMKATGGMIFAYGWILLIVDRFKAGFHQIPK